MTNSSLYILHIGPTVLGAYSTPSRLIEAVTEWHNEFLRRFERAARRDELPRMTFVEVDKNLEDKQQIATGENTTEVN